MADSRVTCMHSTDEPCRWSKCSRLTLATWASSSRRKRIEARTCAGWHAACCSRSKTPTGDRKLGAGSGSRRAISSPTDFGEMLRLVGDRVQNLNAVPRSSESKPGP